MSTTGVLLLPPGYHPLIDGAVVPSGKLQFYRTGTTTAQDTYSDSTLSTPNANPVQLNAAGGLDTLVYGDPSTGFKYRMRVLSSADAVLDTHDDVSVDLPDSSLSSNVPLLDASNTFTNANQIINPGASNVSVWLRNSANASSGFVLQVANADNTAYFWNYETAAMVFATANSSRYTIAADGSHDFKSGSVITANDTSDEVGFKGVPQNAISDAAYTFVLSDAGKHCYYTGASGRTHTIPANASVAFPVGTVLTFIHFGGGTQTIAIASDTLYLAGAGTTGSRTLAQYGIAVMTKIGPTGWVISGTGVT